MSGLDDEANLCHEMATVASVIVIISEHSGRKQREGSLLNGDITTTRFVLTCFPRPTATGQLDGKTSLFNDSGLSTVSE